MSYAIYQPSVAPPWLQGPNGRKWLEAHGEVKDDLVQRVKAAVMARMPGQAPPDALPLLGDERQILRGLSEDDATYAERLRKAWESWRLTGTPLGLLRALDTAGFRHAALVQANERAFTLDANGELVITTLGTSPWIGSLPVPISPLDDPPRHSWTFTATDLDTEPAPPLRNPPGPRWFTSRFAVLFPDVEYNSAEDGHHWDEGLPSINNLGLMRLLIHEWKPAKATCMGIYVVTRGVTWGWPVRTWGDNDTWGDNGAAPEWTAGDPADWFNEGNMTRCDV